MPCMQQPYRIHLAGEELHLKWCNATDLETTVMDQWVLENVARIIGEQINLYYRHLDDDVNLKVNKIHPKI